MSYQYIHLHTEIRDKFAWGRGCYKFSGGCLTVCNYVKQSTVEEGGGCPASHRWVLGGHSQWRAPPLTEHAIGRPHALGICVNSLMRWQTLPSLQLQR